MANAGKPALKKPEGGSSDRDSSSSLLTNATSWEEFARRELHENPKKTVELLKNFTKRLSRLESDNFSPYLEPYFVLSFLRVNKFDEEKARECYQRFFRIRTIDPDCYFPVNRGSLSYKPILDNNIAFILSTKNPLDGTTIVVATFDFFDASRWHNFRELYTPMALQIIMLLRDPEVQVRGFRLVADLKRFSFRYIRYIPTSLAKVMGESTCGALPIILRGIHLINEPVWYQLLMKMVAPFLTDGESVTQVHGSNLASLHRIIDRSILPKELGGLRDSIRFDVRVKEEFYSRDKEFFRASRFGYAVGNICRKSACTMDTPRTSNKTGRLKGPDDKDNLSDTASNSSEDC